MEVVKRKRGRKPVNKQYFGEKEEKAVVDYIITTSTDQKHEIYNEILRSPFKKMVSSILRTYNNHIGNYDIMEVESDGLSHLVENMVKFRPYIVEYQDKYAEDKTKWVKHRKFRYLKYEDLQAKLDMLELSDDEFNYRPFFATAYAYCGTIVRNFFKDHSKNSRNEIVTNIYLETVQNELEENIIFSYELEDFDETDPVINLFNNVIESIENKIETDFTLTYEEVVVGKSIIQIFNTWDQLFLEHTEDGIYEKKVTNNFAKNKILFYLKELTGMEMKEIRTSMKKYKELYTIIKNNTKD